MGKLISKEKDQKEDWDEIWEDKRLVNRLVNHGRKIYNERWFSLLKPYIDVNDFAEIGCGSSSLLIRVAEHAKNVVGIDYSDEALKVSRKKFKKLGIKNTTFINDNALNFKTKKKFDTVWSQGLIEHFDKPGKVIKEHIKITKKGGTTIISGPYKYSYHNVWYKSTRPKPLRKFWPWTEQQFLSKKLLAAEMKKHCPKQTNYKIKIDPIFGLAFLIVKKK
ncbi:class I SAM-dependent methyltransferase [Nanoarchaeota archaeon]